jgi:tRNA 2-thiouridine synthesizing protein A
MARHLRDARGLLCPLPVNRVQARVEGLDPGEVLEVRCTGPGALHDVPAWCRMHGHRLVATWEDGRELVFTMEIQRAGP